MSSHLAAFVMATLRLAFATFAHCFFEIVDIIVLVLMRRIAARTRRSPTPGWRKHLTWITPLVVADALGLTYRTWMNTRFFLSIHSSTTFDSAMELLVVAAEGIGLFGVYRLFVLNRREVSPPSPLGLTAPEWPGAMPAPTDSEDIERQKEWAERPQGGR